MKKCNKYSFFESIFRISPYCFLIFCCTILNFIYCKIDFFLFTSKNYRAGHFAFNSNGDMIIEYSYKKFRLFFGVKKNGRPFFKDYLGNESFIKKIEITKNYDCYDRYETKNIFVSLNNGENKQFLFSTGADSITEIHSINSEEYNIEIENTKKFFNYEIHTYLFPLLSLGNSNEYIILYLNHQKCIIQKFSFSNFSLSSKIIKTLEFSGNHQCKTVSGFIMNEKIIIFYLTSNFSKYQYRIKILDSNLDSINMDYIIIKEFQIDSFDEFFFKGLYLSNQLIALCYYTETSKLEIKIGKLEENNFNPTLSGDFNVNYNHNNLLNDFIKITEERLAFIAPLVIDPSIFNILLIDLFDGYRNMKIRKYKINDFYGVYKINKELELNLYNNYIVLSSTVVDYTTSKPEDDNRFSIFMMFGYITGSDEYIKIEDYFMDDYINSTQNIINKLKGDKEIQNNIFKYIILDQIKLISIPDELLFYNKVNNTNLLLKNNDILNKDYILKQNDEIIKTDRYYSLDYQNIISEPDYETFNSTGINVPYSQSDIKLIDQKDFYNPRLYYGRTNTLKFKLCQKYCKKCYKYGISNDDQKCMDCLPLYQYFYPEEFPSNCVPFNHFNDKEGKKLVECNLNNSNFYFN